MTGKILVIGGVGGSSYAHSIMHEPSDVSGAIFFDDLKHINIDRININCTPLPKITQKGHREYWPNDSKGHEKPFKYHR